MRGGRDAVLEILFANLFAPERLNERGAPCGSGAGDASSPELEPTIGGAALSCSLAQRVTVPNYVVKCADQPARLRSLGLD